MSADVIKEFLVRLGYQVDQSGEQKFSEGIKNVTAVTIALGIEIAKTAEAVVQGMTRIATNLDSLYFASQRVKASAENVQAFGYAASQMGSSVDEANSTLENFSKFLRINPGGESMLQSWGIQTRDTNGQLRDTTEMLRDLGKLFRGMPYFRAYSLASGLGIDDKMLQALIKGGDAFDQQYKEILHRYGLNAQEAAEQSHHFMLEMRELRANADVLAMVVGTKLIAIFDELQFRWNSLDATTRQNIETGAKWVAGIVAAAAIIASGPIGVITALAVAILGLWDDYKVWQEGGKSLINWGQWKPEIDAAKSAIDALGSAIDALDTKLDNWRKRVGGVFARKAAEIESGNTAEERREQGSDMHKVYQWLAYWGGRDPRTGQKIPDANLVELPSGTGEPSNAPVPHDAVEPSMPQKAAEGPKRWHRNEGGDTSTGKNDIPVASAAMANHEALLRRLEQLNHLPAGLLDAVMATESNRDDGTGQHVVSNKGAAGPFQFMPETAKEYGLRDPYNFNQAAEAAAHLFSDLLKQNNGDLTRALVGYNWGAGNLQKYGMEHAPQESRDYLDRIDSLMNNPAVQEMRIKLADAGDAQPQPPAAPAAGNSVVQTTHITVHGATDPQATAAAIGNEQTVVNERLTRNFQATPTS